MFITEFLLTIFIIIIIVDIIALYSDRQWILATIGVVAFLFFLAVFLAYLWKDW